MTDSDKSVRITTSSEEEKDPLARDNIFSVSREETLDLQRKGTKEIGIGKYITGKFDKHVTSGKFKETLEEIIDQESAKVAI